MTIESMFTSENHIRVRIERQKSFGVISKDKKKLKK
jgi:hypothetical protein